MRRVTARKARPSEPRRGRYRPRAGRLVAAFALAAWLGGCGGQASPENPGGVWRYGVAPVDDRVATARTDVAAAPPTAPGPALPPSPTATPPRPAPATKITPTASPVAARGGAYEVVPVVGGGTIRGVVRVEGPVSLPPLRVTKDHDRGCGAPEQPSERLVVDPATGGVGNALVLLSGIRRGKDWPEGMRDAGRTAVLDQHGCRYVPHVFWARPDTQLVIVNSDRCDHNIHAYRDSMRDTAFNISSEPGTRKDQNETSFLEQTGTYILKCDIHPWMSGYLHVLPHPYATVTQAVARDGLAPGEFLLTDVPPGTYDLLVWKEGQVETPLVAEGKIVAYNYSPDFTETRKVTVEAGGTVTVEIVLPVR